MNAPAPRPRVIVLTGPMGAGKTAVGGQLARHLSAHFYDTDHVIEQRTGRTIAEIFAVDGEAAFRQLEEQTCVDLIQNAKPCTILALGGGAFMSAATRAAANQGANQGADVVSVYLHTSPETSWARIRRSVHGASKRPLLSHPDPLGKLRDLYAQRHPHYAEAGLTVSTDAIQTNDVVLAIEAYIDARARAPR